VQIDGQPDHAAPVPVVRTEGISPKAIAATAWAFLAPLLLVGADALVAYLVDNPLVLAALPLVVQVPILAMLAALGAALAAYRAGPGVVSLANGSRGA
jgi:hypothetical protein